MDVQKLWRWVNTTGLVLGMAGVLIIFIWGPPQPLFQIGVAIGLEDGNILASGKTVRQQNLETEMRRRLYGRMSKIGLALIFFGFALQLVCSWPTEGPK
jgi:hypothetical protein